MYRRTVLALPAALALSSGAAFAQTKEVTIAHQDMIVPFRVQQAAGAVEKATGYKINWKMFGGGGDVIKAMASGEVPIGEVGSSPATAAAAQGMDVQVIWIIDDINNAEQLVVSEKSGIKALADLKGKKIATPLASTAHYQLMFALSARPASARRKCRSSTCARRKLRLPGSVATSMAPSSGTRSCPRSRPAAAR